MSGSMQSFADNIKDRFGDSITGVTSRLGEVTIEVERTRLLDVCRGLRDDEKFACEQLIDVCGVDYSAYGAESAGGKREGPRFAVVYHLLSLKHNRRLRIRSYLDDEMPVVDSVIEIWSSANWFEREAFDMFGIVFKGHPDLRRILTDYGFVGHPFRKDFPISGHVEAKYDPGKRRVVYQPVSIDPRMLVPRVIREEGFGG